ncbi:hypothetical protein OPT61_g8245 [Boeremia exigua]|uniref:Uncharacterized protein n=1 Tax=Boeremia exigua TaxID=749465 RepID=A0ACC2HZ02_9PLEO|nr:hypothetical protein OPT61_g8245 [Boeremia exigua]
MLWQPCLVCKEHTANYCKHCAQTDQTGALNARFYCDIDCRKEDELEHLKVHMNTLHTAPPDMERAIKAGTIAQSLFYAFMENTWTYDMKKVYIKRDELHDLVAVEVTDGAGVVTAAGGHTDCRSYAGGWLIEFPAGSFSLFDDDAKHALLTDRSSTWVFVVMHAAVQALFQDLVADVQTDIKEVVHYPTDKATRLVHCQGTFGFDTRRHDQLYPDEDERGNTKGVYEITLKCGSKIALDLAGAQWDLHDDDGPHTPVAKWTEYWSRWGASVKCRIPFRSHVLKHTSKLSNYRMVTSQTLIMESAFYFNVLMSSACKAELGFDPRELLDMDIRTYRDAKQHFLTKAEEYLQRRPYEVDHGNHQNILNGFDLRHPKVIAETPKPQLKSNGSLPLDIGDMTRFDWKLLSRFIQQSNTEVSWKEKKWAKTLQKKRSVYKEPGTWQMVFLEDTLPGSMIPADCMSENPGWKLDNNIPIKFSCTTGNQYEINTPSSSSHLFRPLRITRTGLGAVCDDDSTMKCAITMLVKQQQPVSTTTQDINMDLSSLPSLLHKTCSSCKRTHPEGMFFRKDKVWKTCNFCSYSRPKKETAFAYAEYDILNQRMAALGISQQQQFELMIRQQEFERHQQYQFEQRLHQPDRRMTLDYLLADPNVYEPSPLEIYEQQRRLKHQAQEAFALQSLQSSNQQPVTCHPELFPTYPQETYQGMNQGMLSNHDLLDHNIYYNLEGPTNEAQAGHSWDDPGFLAQEPAAEELEFETFLANALLGDIADMQLRESLKQSQFDGSFVNCNVNEGLNPMASEIQGYPYSSTQYWGEASDMMYIDTVSTGPVTMQNNFTAAQGAGIPVQFQSTVGSSRQHKKLPPFSLDAFFTGFSASDDILRQYTPPRYDLSGEALARQLVSEVGLAIRFSALYRYWSKMKQPEWFQQVEVVDKLEQKKLIEPWGPLSDWLVLYEIELEDILDHCWDVTTLDWQKDYKLRALKYRMFKLLRREMRIEAGQLLNAKVAALFKLLAELTGQTDERILKNALNKQLRLMKAGIANDCAVNGILNLKTGAQATYARQ